MKNKNNSQKLILKRILLVLLCGGMLSVNISTSGLATEIIGNEESSDNTAVGDDDSEIPVIEDGDTVAVPEIPADDNEESSRSKIKRLSDDYDSETYYDESEGGSYQDDYAALPDSVSVETGITNDYEELAVGYVPDDPQKGREQVYEDDPISGRTEATQKVTLEELPDVSDYVHDARFAGKKVYRGIDVSQWQGDIDWKKVKAAGVDFAFVRVAFRGYGAAGTMRYDTHYPQNLRNAVANGIPVGVYFFSQATTPREASQEAKMVLDVIGDYKISFPIIMDFEYFSDGSGDRGRLYDAKLTKRQATDVCNAFCKTAADGGYEACVYANKSMLENQMYANEVSDKYKIWLARWNKSAGYSGDYSYWQFSDRGTVDGISGRVDLDFSYEYPAYNITYRLGLEDATNGGNPQTFGFANTSVYLKPAECGNRIFKGWYLDEACTREITELTKDITEDITLYAAWEDKLKASDPEFFLEEELLSDGAVREPGDRIDIESLTRNAQIYYTFDSKAAENLTPENGILYTDAIEVNREDGYTDADGYFTLYARAVGEDYADSNTVSISMYVRDISGDWGDITPEDAIEMRLANASDVTDELRVAGIKDAEYTGSAIVFSNMRVFYGKRLLSANKDYSLRYTSNVNAGTGTVIINGKGDYSGSISRNFNILPTSFANVYVDSTRMSFKENGKVQKANFTLYYINDLGKKVALKKDRDYSIWYVGLNENDDTYIENAFKDAGNYTIKIKGKGNFSEESIIELTEVITKDTPMSAAKIVISGGEYNNHKAVYPTVAIDAAGIELKGYLAQNAVTDTQARDEYAAYKASSGDADYQYIYYCLNNCEISNQARVVITGIEESGYAGTIYKTFSIKGNAINKADIKGIDSQPYTGTNVEPPLTIFWGDRALKGYHAKNAVTDKDALNKYKKYLADNVDAATSLEESFVYYYSNNVNKGKAKVRILGVNDCTGAANKNFIINNCDISKSYTFDPGNTDATIKVTMESPDGKDGAYAYRRGGVKPIKKVEYRLADGSYKLLENGVDYKLSYQKNDGCNIATVKITGKKSFSGVIYTQFSIGAKSLSHAKVKRTAAVFKNKTGAYKLKPEVYDTDGVKMTLNRDYIITGYTYAQEIRCWYMDGRMKKSRICKAGEPVLNTDIIPAGGQIKVTIEGIGSYEGTNSGYIDFTVASISSAKIFVNDRRAYTYTGSEIRPTKNEIKVKIGIKELNPEDYKIVLYTNNVSTGKAGIVIKGTGNYSGTAKGSFTIGKRKF